MYNAYIYIYTYYIYIYYIRIDRYEVHTMNKYHEHMSMCGYVHINMFIYGSVFVHACSGLLFYGG